MSCDISCLSCRNISGCRVRPVTQPAPGENAKQNSHTCIRHPENIVLNRVTAKCSFPDKVVQDDSGSHVIESMHNDGAQCAAFRFVESEGQINGSRHCRGYKLPPTHVINVSQHQRKVPVGPEKPQHKRRKSAGGNAAAIAGERTRASRVPRPAVPRGDSARTASESAARPGHRQRSTPDSVMK